MNKQEKEWVARVAALNCIICQRPAEIHHIREGAGGGQRASNFDVLPLCPDHHRNGGYGVAIHAGQKEWERLYGTERELHEAVIKQLEGR